MKDDVHQMLLECAMHFASAARRWANLIAYLACRVRGSALKAPTVACTITQGFWFELPVHAKHSISPEIWNSYRTGLARTEHWLAQWLEKWMENFQHY